MTETRMHRNAFGPITARVGERGVRLAFYFTTQAFKALADQQPVPQVCVRRKQVRGFTWGSDYGEYFDGIKPETAGTVFDGVIEPINRRKFEFLDTAAKVGETYAYWVSCPLSRLPTGPAVVRVRDRRIWWSHDEIEARLSRLATMYPALVALKSFGMSVGGHVIPGLVAGNPDRCIALVGAIHAGESGPELMIPAVERLLAGNATLLRKTGIALLPSVNVDERERLVGGCPWYLRTNARGVDINRNFDADWEAVDYNYGLISSDPDGATFRGPKPESEPETQAVTAFLSAVSPKAVLSYHALAGITGARFLAPRKAKDDADYVNACKAFVDPFIAAFYPENRWGAGLCFGTSPGSLPAYAYHKLRVPCFDLEHDANPEAVPSLTDTATPELLNAYQERHYHGILATLKILAGC